MQFGHELKGFGRYQVGRELGSGSYANVYRAFDTEHSREVALRILRKVAPDVLEAERKGARYHEMLSLNANTSGYVPAFFDAGTIDGHFYVAMEFVEGAAPKSAGSISDAVDLGIQLTEALHQFHHVDFEVEGERVKAVVHGDLKPDHIRITPAGIKFLDFGFVKALTLTRRNEKCDFINDSYCSPEMIEGVIDESGDLWSIGVILYELIYHKHPFKGTPVESLREAILARSFEPARSASCPEPLRFVLKKMLAGQPTLRYENAESIRKDLVNYKSGQITEAERFWVRQEEATHRVYEPAEPASEETHRTPSTNHASPPVVLTATPRNSFRRLASLLVVGLLAVAIGLAMAMEAKVVIDSHGLRDEIGSVSDNDIANLARLAEECDDLAARSITGLSLHRIQAGLKEKIKTGVAHLAEDLGHDSPARLTEWPRARQSLQFASRVDPSDSQIQGWLSLAEGMITNSKASAEKNLKEKAKLASTAASSMTRAAELLPNRPEPYYVLASVYFYHLKDYEKGIRVHETLQSKGFQLGKREAAEIADMHKALADSFYRQWRLEGRPAECGLIGQAEHEYEMAVDAYALIQTFANSGSNRNAAQRGFDEMQKLMKQFNCLQTQ